jgi:tetratricopeptide (TPR) repeat protein
MLAKVLVDRPEPDSQLALRLVDGIHPSDPHRAALARAIEGDAHFWERRYDQAEPAWLEALRLEPTIAEVGWKLLNIYAIQGRDEDSSKLALRLFATEPDPYDRVQLLLQLLRHDAHAIEAGSVVHELEPVVQSNPEDLHSSVALGKAMIRCGRGEEGLGLLRRAVRSHADDLDAWLGYLDGLIGTGELDEMAGALDRIPRPLADSARFDAARGWLATQRRDLDGATRAYRRALEARPSDAALAYRFKNVLRQGERSSEFAELSPRLDVIARFPETARSLYDRMSELPDLGLNSHPEIFREASEALAPVGRKEEADAWARMAPVQGRRLP